MIVVANCLINIVQTLTQYYNWLNTFLAFTTFPVISIVYLNFLTFNHDVLKKIKSLSVSLKLSLKVSVSIFPFVALDTSACHLAVESRNKVTIAVFHAINWKFDVTDHEDTVLVKSVESE